MVQNMLNNFKKPNCRMSLKLHLLHSGIVFCPNNRGAIRDEYGERFHQQISAIESRYWSQWILADYCWLFLVDHKIVNNSDLERDSIKCQLNAIRNIWLLFKGKRSKRIEYVNSCKIRMQVYQTRNEILIYINRNGYSIYYKFWITMQSNNLLDSILKLQRIYTNMPNGIFKWYVLQSKKRYRYECMYHLS